MLNSRPRAWRRTSWLATTRSGVTCDVLFTFRPSDEYATGEATFMQFPSDDRNFGGAQQQVATAHLSREATKSFINRQCPPRYLSASFLQFLHPNGLNLTRGGGFVL